LARFLEGKGKREGKRGEKRKPVPLSHTLYGGSGKKGGRREKRRGREEKKGPVLCCHWFNATRGKKRKKKGRKEGVLTYLCEGALLQFAAAGGGRGGKKEEEARHNAGRHLHIFSRALHKERKRKEKKRKEVNNDITSPSAITDLMQAILRREKRKKKDGPKAL